MNQKGEQKQAVFKIIHNFRKHKTRRHKQAKLIPPRSIKTRRMTAMEQNKQPQEQMQMIGEAPSIPQSEQLYNQILREDDQQIVLENAIRTSQDNEYQEIFAFITQKNANLFPNQQL